MCTARPSSIDAAMAGRARRVVERRADRAGSRPSRRRRRAARATSFAARSTRAIGRAACGARDRSRDPTRARSSSARRRAPATSGCVSTIALLGVRSTTTHLPRRAVDEHDDRRAERRRALDQLDRLVERLRLLEHDAREQRDRARRPGRRARRWCAPDRPSPRCPAALIAGDDAELAGPADRGPRDPALGVRDRRRPGSSASPPSSRPGSENVRPIHTRRRRLRLRRDQRSGCRAIDVLIGLGACAAMARRRRARPDRGAARRTPARRRSPPRRASRPATIRRSGSIRPSSTKRQRHARRMSCVVPPSKPSYDDRVLDRRRGRAQPLPASSGASRRP